MSDEMPRQSESFQFPFPVFGGNVSVSDLTVQREGELSRNPMHVLRARTGEFVYATEMGRRIGEDGGDHLSDVSCGNWIGLAQTKRQFDAAPVANARGRQRLEALQKHGRTNGDDRQA